MKKVLLVLGLFVFTPGYAIDKDSLQQLLSTRYGVNFSSTYDGGPAISGALVNTAATTFAPGKMMELAPELYVGTNDRPIRALVDTTMSRFFSQQYMQLSCHHFEADMEPILAVYAQDRCDYITRKLSAQGIMAQQATDKQLEDFLSESAIAQAKSESFKTTAAQMRIEYGQDKIIHSLGCSSLFIYKDCDYLRRMIIEQSISRILEDRKEFFHLQNKMLYAAFDSAVINGNYELLKPYLDKSGAVKIRKAVSTLRSPSSKIERARVYSTATTEGNHTVIRYHYKAGTSGMLGGLNVQHSWENGKRVIKSAKYIPHKLPPGRIKGADQEQLRSR